MEFRTMTSKAGKQMSGTYDCCSFYLEQFPGRSTGWGNPNTTQQSCWAQKRWSSERITQINLWTYWRRGRESEGWGRIQMFQRCAERSLDIFGGGAEKVCWKTIRKKLKNPQAYIRLGIGHIFTVTGKNFVINGLWVQSSEWSLPSSGAKLVPD